MTIHHFNILGCPFCGHLYRWPVFGSYNTFSAKFWSDGVVTNGVPITYDIIKCQNPQCKRKIFFANDADFIGIQKVSFSLDFNEKKTEDPPEWENATHLNQARPTFNDLCDFLEKSRFLTNKQELILRKEIIIKFNDYFRDNYNWEPTQEEYIRMKENLYSLIKFLENTEDEKDLLSVAEYYRELGEFDKALPILKNVKSEKLREWKEKMYSLTKLQVKKLVNLNTIAVRKEYCCNGCKKSAFVYDQQKLDSKLTYGVFFCNACKRIGNTNVTMANPVNYYNRNFFQKIFIKYKPIKDVKEPLCGYCNSRELIFIDIEHDKCPYCKTGGFEKIEWDW